MDTDEAVRGNGGPAFLTDDGGETTERWKAEGEVVSRPVLADGVGVVAVFGAPGAASEPDDWDRWRMDSSDGLRRRSWLLEARWPGVWLRCIGGTGPIVPPVALALEALAVLAARSRSSRRLRLSSLPLDLVAAAFPGKAGWSGSMGDTTSVIFCDRTTLERWGERGVWRPGSAMAGYSSHWPAEEVLSGARASGRLRYVVSEAGRVEEGEAVVAEEEKEVEEVEVKAGTTRDRRQRGSVTGSIVTPGQQQRPMQCSRGVTRVSKAGPPNRQTRPWTGKGVAHVYCNTQNCAEVGRPQWEVAKRAGGQALQLTETLA